MLYVHYYYAAEDDANDDDGGDLAITLDEDGGDLSLHAVRRRLLFLLPSLRSGLVGQCLHNKKLLACCTPTPPAPCEKKRSSLLATPAGDYRASRPTLNE